MHNTIYYNGQFKNIDDVNISINDRGYLYGHSVYESISIINQKALLLPEHFNRLSSGLHALGIKNPLTLTSLEAIIQELCDVNDNQKYIKCYLQITAGDTSERNYSNFSTPNVLVRFYEWNKNENNNFKAIIVDDKRWGLCHVKSNSLAYNALAGKMASEQNAIEAIFIKDYFVQECSTSNLFICLNNTLYTPKTSEQLLHGVTREWVINCAKRHDIHTVEKKIHLDELLYADEVFITASYKGVHPITMINDKIINNNNVGEITQRLQEYYNQYAYDTICSN